MHWDWFLKGILRLLKVGKEAVVARIRTKEVFEKEMG